MTHDSATPFGHAPVANHACSYRALFDRFARLVTSGKIGLTEVLPLVRAGFAFAFTSDEAKARLTAQFDECAERLLRGPLEVQVVVTSSGGSVFVDRPSLSRLMERFGVVPVGVAPSSDDTSGSACVGARGDWSSLHRFIRHLREACCVTAPEAHITVQPSYVVCDAPVVGETGAAS